MAESACMNYESNNNDNFQNVEIKVIDAKKNRSLIAKKMFSKGEVIFSETPLVSSQFAWNKFYNYKSCEYCMKPLETAEENVRRLTQDQSIKLPYLSECCETQKASHCKCVKCGVEYCSEKCRQSAQASYHEAMCLGAQQNDANHPFNIMMDMWRQIHLPPETTTIELIVKLIATMKQATDKTGLINKLQNFECDLVNQKEQIPHKLLNEKYFGQLESLRQVTYELFTTHLSVKECEPWLTEEGFRRIFSLIGRNSQGIGTSPFSVWVENSSNLTEHQAAEHKKLNKQVDKIYDQLDKVSGAFLNSEGSGLYALQSMINHSCRPNSEITFKNNHVLTLVAVEDIQPGQEILISYLDDCDVQRSRHSRQKMLRENYLFTCECARCVEESNQSDVTSDEDSEEEEFDDEFEDASASSDEEKSGDKMEN